jgi:hypothetical protein
MPWFIKRRGQNHESNRFSRKIRTISNIQTSGRQVMGLFVCHKCKCVESTALGSWWSRQRKEMFKYEEDLKGHEGEGLCSECMPAEFSDGGKYGKKMWHNRFEKRHIDDFLKSESAKYYTLMPNGYLAPNPKTHP